MSVFARVGTDVATAPTNWATLTGTNNLANGTTNLVSECDVFGPINASGNTINWIAYGEAQQSSIAGPSSPQEFNIAFKTNESDTVHSALVGSSIGDDIECAIVIMTGTDNQTAYYVRGTVASKNETFDTPASCSVGVTMAAERLRIAES